ncbi:unnamed protein product [Lactuca virosa]|uniref:TF-B3 domain-containing protein n=1 Tax=Lactuca virosa TaxID=75947 RepID=A0AAU9LSB0_9ASTR|nr:unnamed protein product [Lactuca virosa]
MKSTPQDSQTRRKRDHSAAMGYNKEAEDEYYLKKIQELVNKKMELLAVQQEKDSKTLKPPTVNTKMNSKRKVSTRRLKNFITTEMNGKDMTVVINKKLYESDLLESQNRLSMPMKQLKTDEFLTENEKQDLENGKEFEVGLLGPTLRLHQKPMVMKMWRLKSTGRRSYVLKTNWNEFVKENEKEMKRHSKIQMATNRFKISGDLGSETVRFSILDFDSSSGDLNSSKFNVLGDIWK